MSKNPRLSAEARRHSILASAAPLFAKKGFAGATTKQIAQAARVSEALLYKHFPSKEAIYAELKDTCCHDKILVSQRMSELEPSTSTLVHGIYFLVRTIFLGDIERDDNAIADHEHIHRLMAHSYLEDGQFARMFLNDNLEVWEPILTQCIEAAIEAGDMVEPWLSPKVRLWLAHHIGVALGFLNLPKERVIDYGVSKEELLDQAVRFVLRGMGLTDAAIRTHYNPGALALFTDQLRSLPAESGPAAKPASIINGGE